MNNIRKLIEEVFTIEEPEKIEEEVNTREYLKVVPLKETFKGKIEDGMVFDGKSGTLKISLQGKEITVDVDNKFDKTFKNEKELIKFLNQEKATFTGME